MPGMHQAVWGIPGTTNPSLTFLSYSDNPPAPRSPFSDIPPVSAPLFGVSLGLRVAAKPIGLGLYAVQMRLPSDHSQFIKPREVFNETDLFLCRAGGSSRADA